ncbi:KTSC domain-containing protein [Candidatus Thioglobus sp.]|nr:KTSC domain-containing protein [Candidatus Thioglobus sp.]
MIEWITVFSNDIQKIGYDSTTNKLHIDFKDGTDTHSTYCNVPKDLYYQFVSASSVVFFYNQFIKDKYAC